MVLVRPAPPSAAPVPALGPDEPYSSRLSARSALYSELCLLLDGLTVPLAPPAYQALVVQENCLGRPSVASRRKLWKELRSRYRLDARDPLFAAFWDEWRRSESEPERSLTAYVLFALNDRLVCDLGIEWLYPLLRRAPAEFDASDVLAYINRSKPAHPEVAAWSDNTMRAVAQKYCASIRDFGLAKGTIRKKTVRPAIYGSPIRFLIKALRLANIPTLAQVRNQNFRLLAIDPTEVIDALGELNRKEELRFRQQGDIVELELAERA